MTKPASPSAAGRAVLRVSSLGVRGYQRAGSLAFVTPANIHDSTPGDQMICGDERMVIADKGYHSKRRRALLAKMGIRDGIMRRSGRGHPLSAKDRARNRRLAPIRSAVERVFGTLKRSYGWTRVRYRGLAKNASHFFLLCIALNLRRALVLTT